MTSIELANALAAQQQLVDLLGMQNVAPLTGDEARQSRARYEMECAKLTALREQLLEAMRVDNYHAVMQARANDDYRAIEQLYRVH
jgi:hypothetical protein